MAPPPTYHRLASLVVVISVFASPATAFACPGEWYGLDCDGGGADPVCQVLTTTAPNTYECDLTRNGDTASGDVYAVYEASGSVCPADYCVWGQDAASNQFCCAVDGEQGATDLSVFVILGGSSRDQIRLVGSSLYMDNWTTGVNFETRVYGRGGDDTLYGSESANTEYADKLWGDGGSDELVGLAGADWLEGGNDHDYLFGGDGPDEISGSQGDDDIDGGDGVDQIMGGSGDDTIDGGSGADVIHAGDDNDVVQGGPNNDTIYGEGGGDIICGGVSDSDVMYGNQGDDLLYGADLADYAYGGVGTNRCDEYSISTDCTPDVTSESSTCP